MSDTGSGPRPATAFPDSLCHSCAAPPRYVVNDRGSVFIHCPLLRMYPPQPVTTCNAYVPAEGTA